MAEELASPVGGDPVTAVMESPAVSPAEICRGFSLTSSRPVTAAEKTRFVSDLKNEVGARLARRQADFEQGPGSPLSQSFLADLKRLRENLAVINSTVMIPRNLAPSSYLAPQVPLTIGFREGLGWRSPVAGLPAGEPPSEEEANVVEETMRRELAARRPDFEAIKRRFLNRDFRLEHQVISQRYVPALEQALIRAAGELRRQALTEYEQLISSNPFLAYLPNARPTPQQIETARRAYAASILESRRRIGALAPDSAEGRHLILFGPSTAAVLRQDPARCAVYSALAGQLQGEARTRGQIVSAAEIGGALTCTAVTIVTIGWGLPCFAAAGAAVMATATTGLETVNRNLGTVRAGVHAGQVPVAQLRRQHDEQTALGVSAVMGGVGTVMAGTAVARPVIGRVISEARILNGGPTTSVNLLTNNGMHYSYRGGLYRMDSNRVLESSRGVVYLREEYQRAPYLADIVGGRLLQRASRQPFQFGRDPARSHVPRSAMAARVAHGQDVRGIFVIDRGGRLMVHPAPRQGRFHHSSFMAGDDVIAAGEIMVSADGRIRMINTGSGHYLPKPENADEVIRYLQAHGFNGKVAGRRTLPTGVHEVRFAN